ncbi:SusC/RagA family TonB-linked outer membrane protein [Sphingobacterium sp. UDSM-2020]|uniref:SusC/RagA family TonB-linked outer membrane protein n=1 Tax=Sphingobacterium sp. UDSM-2020 TaxID=2795738 RepID=UPI001937DD54|nr:TonB-dependent receptor [Sphingobacterium sp. UDSM-2020]QQD15466.1 TonB-dependent receptor [Sphingobacterium sp. UDSM-2020]
MKENVLFWKGKGFFIFFFLLLGFNYASGQITKIQGIVRNATGILPGVTVAAEGSSLKTQTDGNGQYSLNINGANAVIFTFIGYEKQRIVLQDVTDSKNGIYTLNVTLKESEGDLLDEVVVVGFGTQKKTNLTGSVAVVDAKQLENRPVRNAIQALQGLAPGLNISQNGGSLEANPTINIRGVGTIGTSSSSPLVLIDGSEGSLAALNPQDIESVSVLKDAGAASIYGSRAAFGVILVTTKSGKVGKTTVNYNNSLRMNKPTLMPKMMDSYTFAQYFNQAEVNGNGTPHFSEEYLKRILDYQNGSNKNSIIVSPDNPQYWADGYAYGNDNVDWFKAMYRDQAFSHEHNLSLNGGSDKTTYYLSGNFMKQQGLMAFNTDHYDRYAISAKINSKVSDIFQIGYNARLVREDYERPAALTNSFYDDLGRQGWPTLPLYDPNGFLYSSPSPALVMKEGGVDNSTKDYIYQQLQLTLEPLKGWKTIANLNYRTTTQFRHWDSQKLYNHDVNGNPYLYKNTSNVYEFGLKENYYNINIYSEYDKRMGDHHFKGMVGFQAEQTAFRNLGVQRDGIILPDQPVINIASGTDINGNPVVPSVSGEYQKWASAGFFGRLNYDFRDKYLFEANLRYDGSSRFRSDSRWGWFPSVSAGWNVAKETFFEEALPYINMFKFRASYGELGNQNTEIWYPTYVVQPTGTNNGGWLINNARPNTASAPGLVSALLTWESINTTNIGVDFAALNNKLSGSFEVFDRRTYDMVGPAPQLPVTLGTQVPETNNTDLKTQGFEATIGWNDRTKGGLSYGAKFLISDNVTTITRYPNEIGVLNKYRKNQRWGDIWGLQTLGIAKSQEEMDRHLASLPNGGQTAIGTQWAAGDVMYKDINGDGKIDKGGNTEGNPGDLSVIGNNTPRYTFGLNLNAEYKNFDFSIFFQGVMKRDVWQGGYYFWGATGNKWWSTGLVDHLDYFRTADNVLGENLDGYYARPTFGTSKNQEIQSRYLQNASYIRIKNVQLGYTIPKATTNRIGVERLRVYIAGENVWTGSKVAGMFDPETIDGGSNGTVYPLTKVWSAGLSVTF